MWTAGNILALILAISGILGIPPTIEWYLWKFYQIRIGSFKKKLVYIVLIVIIILTAWILDWYWLKYKQAPLFPPILIGCYSNEIKDKIDRQNLATHLQTKLNTTIRKNYDANELTKLIESVDRPKTEYAIKANCQLYSDIRIFYPGDNNYHSFGEFWNLIMADFKTINSHNSAIFNDPFFGFLLLARQNYFDNAKFQVKYSGRLYPLDDNQFSEIKKSILPYISSTENIDQLCLYIALFNKELEKE